LLLSVAVGFGGVGGEGEILAEDLKVAGQLDVVHEFAVQAFDGSAMESHVVASPAGPELAARAASSPIRTVRSRSNLLRGDLFARRETRKSRISCPLSITPG